MRAIEPHTGNIIKHFVTSVVDNYIKKSTSFDLVRFMFFILQDLFNPAGDVASSELTGVSGKINLSMPQSFQVFSNQSARVLLQEGCSWSLCILSTCTDREVTMRQQRWRALPTAVEGSWQKITSECFDICLLVVLILWNARNGTNVSLIIIIFFFSYWALAEMCAA